MLRTSRSEHDAPEAALDPRALGLAGGITTAVWVVSIGLLARIGWGDRWRALFSDLYLGYDESTTGLAVGAAWAFVDGFTVGAAFAWLYNRFERGR